MPTIGSLFSGAGLLDAGLALAGWKHSWLCEADPFRRDLLAKRFPGAVIYDDIRTLRGQASADAADAGCKTCGRDRIRDGASLVARCPTCSASASPVDLIAGGFPCKGASTAGKRGGFEHAETVLWHEMRRVISELRPRHVLIENVANILGMAAAPGLPPGSLWGIVLGDLATLGFNVVWDCLPAAAIGAPHLRDRVYAIATQSTSADEQRDGDQRRRSDGWSDVAGGRHCPAAYTNGSRGQGHGGTVRVQSQVTGADRNDDLAGSYPDERQLPAGRDGGGANGVQADPRRVAVDWGDYQSAISRWETIHGPAPEPLIRRLDDGNTKLQRMRARVDRSEMRTQRQRLSALGDGVHVYLGWLVGQHLMSLALDGSVS